MNTCQRKYTIFILAVSILLTSAIMILASRSTRAAGPWYVAPGGSDGNTCTSPGAACATINGAIAKASSGDTIYVATGTYTDTSHSDVISLDRNLTLSGGWDGAFTMQNGTSIADGKDVDWGISVNHGVTAIVGRFVISNTGRGVHNGGTLTLNNSTISGSGNDGGIDNGGTLTLNGCTVKNNAGGGIHNSSYSTLTLNSSIVSGNTTPLYGSSGGIYNGGGGNVILNNSAVSGNTAGGGAAEGNGGGIDNGGTMILNNCTVSGNTAGGNGGGINNGGTLTLNSSTVSDNIAGDNGGGIYTWGYGVTLQNTILAGNEAETGPNCTSYVSAPIGSQGYNLIDDTADCVFSPTTGELLNIDAILFPLTGSPGYHPFPPSSPAIDAGNPAACTNHLGYPLNTDQRGVARVGRCDIGSYEFDPAIDPLIHLPIVIHSD